MIVYGKSLQVLKLAEERCKDVDDEERKRCIEREYWRLFRW